jgi:hypothetical protein
MKEAKYRVLKEGEIFGKQWRLILDFHGERAKKLRKELNLDKI